MRGSKKVILSLDFGWLGEQDVTVIYNETPYYPANETDPAEEAGIEILSVKWRGVDVEDDLYEYLDELKELLA